MERWQPDNTERITVMAVDDHPIFLDGISSVLTGDPGLELVARACDGKEALQRYREVRPAVTLMDIHMPNMDGIEALEAILLEFPEARIIMLTTFEGDGFALRAIRAGAFGYVIKSGLRRDLVSMVRKVYGDHRGAQLPMAKDLQAASTNNHLTKREIEVLRLVADGQSNKQVGAHLSISEETVKSYMKIILPKLGANDRAHAVALALGRGILSQLALTRDRLWHVIK